MGIDGGEYSRGGKRGVGFGGHVCGAGFLCETALGDFRVGDAIENGTRQSRAPLRAVARTRAPAERPVSLETESPIACHGDLLASPKSLEAGHAIAARRRKVLRRQVDLTLLASI